MLSDEEEQGSTRRLCYFFQIQDCSHHFHHLKGFLSTQPPTVELDSIILLHVVITQKPFSINLNSFVDVAALKTKATKNRKIICCQETNLGKRHRGKRW